MATVSKSAFQRNILKPDTGSEVAALLQSNLVNLIDLALLLKQAHWNVIGRDFRSVHLQLDEIIESVRDASDEVAERSSTLGFPPDGRSATVAQATELQSYPADFQQTSETVGMVADAMKTAIDALRSAIGKLGDLDPISEDLCISIAASLEKHLWMLQAQEA